MVTFLTNKSKLGIPVSKEEILSKLEFIVINIKDGCLATYLSDDQVIEAILQQLENILKANHRP